MAWSSLVRTVTLFCSMSAFSSSKGGKVRCFAFAHVDSTRCTGHANEQQTQGSSWAHAPDTFGRQFRQEYSVKCQVLGAMVRHGLGASGRKEGFGSWRGEVADELCPREW